MGSHGGAKNIRKHPARRRRVRRAHAAPADTDMMSLSPVEPRISAGCQQSSSSSSDRAPEQDSLSEEVPSVIPLSLWADRLLAVELITTLVVSAGLGQAEVQVNQRGRWGVIIVIGICVLFSLGVTAAMLKGNRHSNQRLHRSQCRQSDVAYWFCGLLVNTRGDDREWKYIIGLRIC